MAKQSMKTSEKENQEAYILSNAAVQQAEEDEIDFGKIFGIILDSIHYIILSFMLGALLFNAYAYFMVHPTYQSTAKLYAVSASEDSVVNFADLNIGQALTKDYEELIYSYPVMQEVVDELNLNMTSEQLSSLVSIINPEDTRVLKITTTTTDAHLSQDITNKLVEVIRNYLPKTMSTTKPNIVQEGLYQPKKVGPGYLKYTIVGGILFAGILCVILIIISILDDTLKTPEDIEIEFGFTPLTVIPENEIFNNDDKKTKKTKKSFLKGGKKNEKN